MKMKKLGALLLAGVMTMSTLLTGCGNGASGSSAGGNASQYHVFLRRTTAST